MRRACHHCRNNKHEHCYSGVCSCCGLGKIYEREKKTRKAKRLIIHQQSVLSRLKNLEKRLKD